MKKLILLLLVGTLHVIGCATPGSTTHTYARGNSYDVKNEKFINASPEAVWDTFVRELSKSYFMINNIDKESRIINVSFSSDNAAEYVDCGKGETKVTKSMLNKRGLDFYSFNICEKNQLVIEDGALNQGGIMAPIICDVFRNPSLEGRMNIYVAPENGGTLVTVNCRYIVTVSITNDCEYYAPAGNLVQTNRKKDSYTCSLDSKRPSSCETLKRESIFCSSTGKLEQEILSLVK